MYATMSVAVVTVVLDPILIFGFGLKANGAAMTINIARVAYVYVSYRYLTRAHDLLVRPNLPSHCCRMRAPSSPSPFRRS